MGDRRHDQVVNIDEVDVRTEAKGGFGFQGRRLGTATGCRALGCGHFEVPPGKTAFPFHFHSNIEEALYILEGTGTARLGDAKIEVRAGDFVAFPPGPTSAHALTNTGAGTLRYLALSAPAAASTVDVVGYPDSKKVAYVAGVDPVKGWRGGAWVMGLHKEQPPAGYYDDEPLASE